MNLLGEYQNGNYIVSLYDDGTKVRENDLDFFCPAFPESLDLKITDYCDMGCPYCHEGSSRQGLHGDILQAEFIDTIASHTELAIGGGNPLSHPDLLQFLSKLKKKNIVANITVNQEHFENNQMRLEFLMRESLIYGLGVSYTNYSDNFLNLLSKYSNAVIHVINGVVDQKELEKLYDKNLKLLILGYKQLRRGNDHYSIDVENNKKIMYDKLPEIVNRFLVASFDNLAIKQLDVGRLLSDKKWQEFYMGDDGQYTMYADLIKGEFAKSSTNISRYPLMNSIADMFDVVRIKG